MGFLDEGAKEYNHQNAEQSKVLNTPGAEKQTKIELFHTPRHELDDGLGKDVSETVERVFCPLCGWEPPLFPLPIFENQPCKETEKGKGKEKEHENEKDNLNSALKKRSYTEMNEEVRRRG
ncbi:hypothetical protein Q3G72_003314 [Acer saccharum]|nr:hypothetical protein Q3G72_003314 [Acer saccharum]